MPTTSDVVIYQPSQNVGLATALMNLEQQFINAARANLGDAVLTPAERNAVEKIEALHLIKGMDLAALQLRYKLIREIRDNALFSMDPRGYNRLEDMAEAQGISISELSNIMTLNEVIFPYLIDHMQMDVAQIWESISKSNWRDLVPILKAIITGEPSGSENVNASMAHLLDDIAATNFASNVTMTDAEIAGEAVDQLLQAGTLPSRRLRERLRPEPTPSIPMSVIRSQGHVYVCAEVSEDQMTMISRKLHGYLELTPSDFPEDRRQRQAEAARLPGLGALMREVE
jgi:hypothetical protein